MDIGNRFRCYPTPEQAQTLLRWLGCQRHIYNSKVREDRYFRTFARKSLSLTGQMPPIDQRYAQFIGPDSAWLRDVPSHVLRNGAYRWRQAYERFFQRLAGRPREHSRHGSQSLWLTSELFRFEIGPDQAPKLVIGTKKHPVGVLAFTAHRAFGLPKSVRLVIEAGRWYLTFSSDDGQPLAREDEIAARLRQMSETDLRAVTFGGDRGVCIPLAGSDGQAFGLLAVQQARMRQKAARTRRWQRRLARRQKGSANREKARRVLAASQRYARAVRQDFAHQTSHTLVRDPRYQLYAFEALKVRQMTAAPKARPLPGGGWQRNGARAKAGLNRAILASAWGNLLLFTQYKARRAGKLVLRVKASHSSQECARCGHIHPDNRISQSVFVCQACGHQAHADHNAGQVIAWRGVRQLFDGEEARPVKRCRVGRRTAQQLGPERSEVTPVESSVSHPVGNDGVRGTAKQERLVAMPETPATSVQL